MVGETITGVAQGFGTVATSTASAVSSGLSYLGWKKEPVPKGYSEYNFG